MTIRELSQVLAEIDDQKVKELRAILLEQDDRDKEITPTDLVELTYGK